MSTEDASSTLTTNIVDHAADDDSEIVTVDGQQLTLRVCAEPLDLTVDQDAALDAELRALLSESFPHQEKFRTQRVSTCARQQQHQFKKKKKKKGLTARQTRNAVQQRDAAASVDVV